MFVESFELIENDLTAITEPTMKYDYNGDKCAIIKVETTQHQFHFDVGSLGIVKKEGQNSEHPSEIWLYVPFGVKKITIKHPILGNVNDYDLGLSVEIGKTYRLKLTTNQVNTLVVDYDNSQYLRTQIEPKDATFYINGIRQPLDENGVCEIPLPFGTHNYRVTALNYHPTEGRIVINSKEQKHELNINLKQAFGYLTIAAAPDMEGAEIFIDDTKVGQIPLSQFPLKSGMHTITISKKLYSPYKDNFAMTDSGFVNLTPVLKPNYAEVSLSIPHDKDAQIYDNGELLGQGSWNGRLEAGKHIIEAKKASHVTTTKEIEIRPNHKVAIVLENPSPIYGTLEVCTKPNNAKVMVDGKFIGRTPIAPKRILIGNHSVKLELDRHRTEKYDIEIRENHAQNINTELTSQCNFMIRANQVANVFINGAYVGETPYLFHEDAGKYKLELIANGYKPFSKNYTFDGNTYLDEIKLKKIYNYTNEIYGIFGYKAVSFPGFVLGIGGYYKNFNMEFVADLGISKSDRINWVDKRTDTMPFYATYKPNDVNIKLGYGFSVGSRFRVTPQIGCHCIALTEKKTEYDIQGIDAYYTIPEKVADGAYCISASANLRITIAITKKVKISLGNEYKISLNQSKGFSALADISSKIKNYSNGYGLDICLIINFAQH